MAFALGKLAQLIHVTAHLEAADAFYSDVFGAERFYSGYSPFEKRDASLLAIGNFVIEPMAPSDEVGADQMPVGRFLGRFGDHLHSIAINTTGVEELYEHLRANDIRVVGPGGSDPTAWVQGDVKSIYTHPKDTHCLLEFVDFGGEMMAASPRTRPDWDPTKWRDEHPLGFVGASHITVLVRDVDRATHFFADVLGCDVFHEDPATTRGTNSRFVALGSETVVELAMPQTPDSRAALDLAANGEIVHSVTLQVVDLGAAVDHLAGHGVAVADRVADSVVLDPTSTYGAVIEMTEASLPTDPRSACDQDPQAASTRSTCSRTSAG